MFTSVEDSAYDAQQVCERIKKTENETIHENIKQMKHAERTKMSFIYNTIIMSAIVQKRRTERLDTYLFLQMKSNVLTICG